MTANPYNFSPIDESNIQTRNPDWKKRDDLKLYCGELTCTMLFKSNFITALENTGTLKKQSTINGQPIIQGSALKGVIRSVAEALSNSCLSIVKDEYEYRYNRPAPATNPRISPTSGVSYRYFLKNGNLHIGFNQKRLISSSSLIDNCNNSMCIACRIFGTTAKKDTNGNDGFNYGGKIRFSDAIYLGQCDENGNIVNRDWRLTKYLRNRHSLGNPKNHHESFYLNRNKIKGRKFYYHHQTDQLLTTFQLGAVRVDLVKKNSVFQFRIAFENLTVQEFGLLLWALELEDGLGHKIGMAKPLGLGSCIIRVTEIKEVAADRYLNINNDGKTVFAGSALTARKAAIKSAWATPIPSELKQILTIDNGFMIAYPARVSREFGANLHPPGLDFAGNVINAPSPDPRAQQLCEPAASVKDDNNAAE